MGEGPCAEGATAGVWVSRRPGAIRREEGRGTSSTHRAEVRADADGLEHTRRPKERDRLRTRKQRVSGTETGSRQSCAVKSRSRRAEHREPATNVREGRVKVEPTARERRLGAERDDRVGQDGHCVHHQRAPSVPV